MFENYFYMQLSRLVNQNIKVTVGEELYSGRLLAADNNIITLSESTDAYERQTRTMVVPLEQISYVAVDAS